MLTRNFWTLFAALGGQVTTTAKTVNLTKIDGTIYSCSFSSSSRIPYAFLGGVCVPNGLSSNYGSWNGTWYGRGRTPATVDDYTLEDPIFDNAITGASGLTALVATVGDGYAQISATQSLTNNTDEEIAVGEVGCFGQISSSGSGILMDRTVLEEPIVIPPKGTVAFEYVIKFPFGT